ncbi:MAG TPA: hypothetical protein VNJ10_09495 [Sphingomonas sp.]|nr:hypothetical protein [Sphingomonas sp.]
MNRISQEELRMMIHVALTVRKKYERARLELQSAHAVETVTDDLVRRIMGTEESETVLIVPSHVGTIHSPKRGAWGVDEPHPHADLPFRHHIPQRPRAET